LAIKLLKRKKLRQTAAVNRAAAANQAEVPNKLADVVMAADDCSAMVKSDPFLLEVPAARFLIAAVTKTRLSGQNCSWKSRSREDLQLESGLTKRGPIAIAAKKGARDVRGECLATSVLGATMTVALKAVKVVAESMALVGCWVVVVLAIQKMVLPRVAMTVALKAVMVAAESMALAGCWVAVDPAVQKMLPPRVAMIVALKAVKVVAESMVLVGCWVVVDPAVQKMLPPRVAMTVALKAVKVVAESMVLVGCWVVVVLAEPKMVEPRVAMTAAQVAAKVVTESTSLVV
jgi:hypothetical protein